MASALWFVGIGGRWNLPHKKSHPKVAFFIGAANSNDSWLNRHYVFSLRALSAVRDGHRHFLAFVQSLATRTCDSTEMHEYILAPFAFNEAPALLVIEPLDRTFYLI
jgi:hypothetical protein